MRDSESHLRALLNLIQDDNLKVASLAMEEFLKQNSEQTEKMLAEHQEAADPRMRGRIHQLSSISNRRRQRIDFIRRVRSQDMGLWEGMCRINSLYDARASLRHVSKRIRGLRSEMLDSSPAGLPKIASIMREHDFTVPEGGDTDIELYLVESVLASSHGSDIILASLAQHIAEEAGWRGSIALHEGRFILVDNQCRLLDPAAGWQVSGSEKEMLHPCSSQDLWLAVLTRLFSIALTEGHLRDIHHFGSLLAALNGGDISALPSPLGKM